MGGDRLKLSVVIPAYDEEDAIATVIDNVRDARDFIIRETNVREVEILVVDDGSRDRTAEIVRAMTDVRLVRHPSNRGYGAALKTGFREASGELLSFLDGDGTCDAMDFVPLCREIETADLVSGCRLGSGTGMPLIRRIGNRGFAFLTWMLSGKRVRDIASGIRVFRRELLDRLPRLPDGLHFTPAMTNHVLHLSPHRFAEKDVSYVERLGSSKLSVLKDGLRFLKIIIDIALIYLPLKILGGLGVLSLAISILYGAGPVLSYLEKGALDEGVIYRLLGITTFITVGLILILLGVVAQKLALLIRVGDPPRSFLLSAIGHHMFQHYLILIGLVVAVSGVVLNWANLGEYVLRGSISAHWGYLLLGGILVVSGALLSGLGVICRIIDFMKTRI